LPPSSACWACCRLSWYTKCLEELSVGNREFEPARKRLEQMLKARMNPAMRYFIDVFVASFSLPLDELNAH